jgi:hypothetical protein
MAVVQQTVQNRHRASSFVITGSRAVDEWVSLFDEPHPVQHRLGPPG